MPVGQAVLAKMKVHRPVDRSQHAVTHGFGVHTPLANHTPWQLACVTGAWQIVVPGMQQAPVVGTPLHGYGLHATPGYHVPPESRQVAWSCMWHAPQQQQAEPGIAHWMGIWLHAALGKNCPPICVHVPAVSCWQICVLTTQHAPVISAAHSCGLHAPPGPYHVPNLFTQSQLEAVMHCPFRQHLPKSTCAGQKPGAHVAPGKYMPPPGHADAVVCVHAPLHGVQHAPIVGHVTPTHDTP